MKISKIFFFLTLVLCLSLVVFGQKGKQLAENFSGATMNGQNVELESLKGKVVVITFWSTKCPIHVSKNPKTQSNSEKLSGQRCRFSRLDNR